MKKYTFVEFTAAQEGRNFNIIEAENLEWATGFIESMSTSANLVHHGDCTKENISCPLCVYETLLREYREYYFEEGDWNLFLKQLANK